MEGSIDIKVKKKPIRVHFSEDTKKHNGPEPIMLLFEKYIVILINHSNKINEFLSEQNLDTINLIEKLLSDLLYRCNSSKSKKIPLLPRGGGKGYSFTSECFEFFNKHLQHLKNIIKLSKAKS
jgi:hypothetical protein